MTSRIRKKSDRIAPVYDRYQDLLEPARFRSLRSRLHERVRGDRALEVGIGTGRNLPHYPPGVAVTGIDLSPRMLEQARKRASDLDRDVDLREMDVQELAFPDESFDTVFATFVFCGVPDPVLGLDEMRRVCRKGGRMVLLEHLRPGGRLMGAVFDVLDTVVVRVAGSHINRRTVDNVRKAGWTIQKDESFFFGIVRWLEAVR